MHRGVVKLSKSEVEALKKTLNQANFVNSPLSVKLDALFEISDNLVNIDEDLSLELSADEIELILDVILLPEEDEPIQLADVRKKLSQHYLEMQSH